MSYAQLQTIIDQAWDSRAEITALNAPQVREAVEQVIADLNGGRLRVAERRGVGDWHVNQWVKKAVLLSFRLNDNQIMRAGDLGFFDKVKTKFAHIPDTAFDLLSRMLAFSPDARISVTVRARARRPRLVHGP